MSEWALLRSGEWEVAGSGGGRAPSDDQRRRPVERELWA